MDKKLFEAVLQESEYYQSEVETEEQLKALLCNGVTVEAKHTGPFGEDMGATVIGFGELKDFRRELFRDGVEDAASEEDYDDVEDWFADNGKNIVVVLDQPIGQGDCNWYDLSGHSISDLNLWANKDEVEKVSKSSNGIIGTWGTNTMPDGNKGPCPNCGGEAFRYVKLPMNIMHGDDYVLCKKCGAMFPYFPWKEGENHD